MCVTCGPQVVELDFSVGAVSQAHDKVTLALTEPVHEAARTLADAPVKNVDETRYPREGTTCQWVWGVVTPRVVVFNLLPSRVRYVIHSLLGEAPQGEGTSDRYAGYAHISVEQHQLCWVHLLRDCARISERHGLPKRIDAKLLGADYVLFRCRQAGKSAQAFEPLQRRIQRALEQGAAQTTCPRTAAICVNLLKSWTSLWAFLHHADVAPTNNDAERALRAIVVKRPLSALTHRNCYPS